MAHIGVKNRTKEPQSLTYDGKEKMFGPSEVKILEGVPMDFIESRMHMQHKKGTDGKIEQGLVGIRLFDVVPMDEALKHAKPEEDPRVIEARKRAEEAAKARASLVKEVKEALLSEGWNPPVKGGR